jgi:hypothetical protein
MCFYCKNGKQNKTPIRLNILIKIRSKSDTQSIRYMTDHLSKKSGMTMLVLKDFEFVLHHRQLDSYVKLYVTVLNII